MKYNKVGKEFFEGLNLEEVEKNSDDQQETVHIMDGRKPIYPKATMDENFFPIELLRYIIDKTK